MAPTSKAKSFATETKLVQDLAAIFDDRELTELELETDQISIRLSRGQQGQAMLSMPQPMAAPVAQAPAAPSALATAEPAPQASAADLASHEGALRSPMVGTVYRAPEPGAADFVSEGDTVKKGQTLFIVEAMKVMNPITAPADGTVTKILVDNAQPIEFDQPLAVIE